MIRRSTKHGAKRAGVSLLEVLIAVTIFLISIAALGQLIDTASDTADLVEERSLAIQICRSKMNEIAAGARANESDDFIATDGGTLVENEDVPDGFRDWEWEMTSDEALTETGSVAQVEGLVKVTVTVRWQSRTRGQSEVSLTQVILKPSARGSTADAATVTGSDDDGLPPDGTTTSGTGN